MRVKTSTANAARLFIYDGSTFTYGSFHTGGGAYETLTITRTLGAAPTRINVGIALGATSTVYADNAMLVEGPTAMSYIARQASEEKILTQRYYWIYNTISGFMNLTGYAAAGGGWYQIQRHPVPMGGTPTMTKNGTWAVTNAGQPTIGDQDPAGFTFRAAATALGQFIIDSDSSDDTITSEWNP
jgi:hypothetical protein